MRNLVLMVFLTFVAPVLRAEIYKCVEPNGNSLYTSDKAQAKAKGCKSMNLVPNTVSSPKPPATGAPAKFPSVDAQTQKQRDTDRRRILEEELAGEQKLLEEAKKKLAEQESIRLGSERNYQRMLDRLEPYKKEVKLHENNIANLTKELANTK